jgi:hypothetical protein
MQITLLATQLLAIGCLATTMDTVIQQAKRTLTCVELVAASHSEVGDV